MVYIILRIVWFLCVIFHLQFARPKSPSRRHLVKSHVSELFYVDDTCFLPAIEMNVGTEISLRGLKGVVRYVGDYHVKPGTWVGIELETPRGKNNGVIAGKKYFECEDKHGLFLSMEDALKFCKIGQEMPKSQSQSVAAPDPKPGIPVAHCPSAEAVAPPTSPRQRSTPQSKEAPAPKTGVKLAVPPLKLGSTAKSPETVSPRNDTQTDTKSPRTSETKKAVSSPRGPPKEKMPSLDRNSPASARLSEVKSTEAMPTLRRGSLTSPRTAAEPAGDKATPTSARAPPPKRTTPPTTKRTVIGSPPPPEEKPKESPQRTGNILETKSVDRMPTLKRAVVVPPQAATSGDDHGKSGESLKESSSESQGSVLGRVVKTRRRSMTDQGQDMEQMSSGDDKSQESPKPVRRMSLAGRRNTSEEIRVTLIPPPESKGTGEPVRQPTSPRRNSSDNATSPRRMSNPDTTTSPGKSGQNQSPRRMSNPDASSTRGPTQQRRNTTEGNPVDRVPSDSKLVPPPPPAIDPEQEKIQQEINELEKKCGLYQQKLDMLKQKKEKMVDELREKRKALEDEAEKQKQEFELEILKIAFDREQDLLKLEEELFQETEEQKKMLMSPDDAKAAEKIDILVEIDSEHRKYQEEFMKFIETQRINRNTVNQTILTLNQRLEKVLKYRRLKEKEVMDLKNQAAKVEKELESKRPQWKSVTELRTQQEQISGKLGSVTGALKQKTQEADALISFYNVFEVPFIECMVAFDRIRDKLRFTTFSDAQKADLMHLCTLGDVVFTYFLNMNFPSKDLMVELENVEEHIERNTLPSVSVLHNSIQKVSRVPLDDTLTCHWICAFRARVNNQEIADKLAQLEAVVTRPLHPKLLNSEADGFSGWMNDLRAELKKGEKGEPCDIGVFIDTAGMFIKDAKPEVSRLAGFFEIVHDHKIELQVDDLTPQWQQEKNDLRDQLDILTPELNDKRKEFEELKSIVSS